MASSQPLLDRMAKAVELAAKLGTIFNARNAKLSPLPASDATMQEVEDYLQVQLPPDYKALMKIIGPGEWGVDQLYILDPKGILEKMKDLQEIYPDGVEESDDEEEEEEDEEETKIQFDPSKPNCFIPFGDSPSAFTYGWIINQTSKDKNTGFDWPIVQCDAESDMQPNTKPCKHIPLVELLYRLVVRSYPKDYAINYAKTSAGRFFHSDAEYERGSYAGMRGLKTDGSMDHAASTPSDTIVFGRTVFGSQQRDENRQVIKEFSISDDQLQSVFNGASEADFNALGDYDMVHPDDQEAKEKADRFNSATKTPALVDIDTTTALLPTKPSGVDEPFWERFKLAASIRRGIAVSSREGMAIIMPDGKLAAGLLSESSVALKLPAKARSCLWLDTEANNLLEEGESFVEVAMGAHHGIALTSSGKVITWGGDGYGQCGRGGDKENNTQQKDYGLVSLDPLMLGQRKPNKVCAGSYSSAIILTNGQVLYWGCGEACHSLQHGDNTPKSDNHVLPHLMEGLEGAVDVEFDDNTTFILCKDGTVLKSTLAGGLERMEGLGKETILALRSAPDHSLYVRKDGNVLGMGHATDGQLPVAPTAEDLKQIEDEHNKYVKDTAERKAKVRNFRTQLKAHAQACPKIKKEEGEPVTKQPRLSKEDTEEPMAETEEEDDDDEESEISVFNIRMVGGIEHTPEACGAPEPEEGLIEGLMWSPSEPPAVAEMKGEHGGREKEFQEPTLLTVGPEHGSAIERLVGEQGGNRKHAWNAVTGPYGMKPGPFSGVVDAGLGYRYSVFLHENGGVSGVGEGTSCCTAVGILEEEESKGGSGEEQKAADVIVNEDKVKDEQIPPSWARCKLNSEILCLRNFGIPLAATLRKPQRFVALRSNHAGTIAVAEDGVVWGCGRDIGDAILMPLEVYSLNESTPASGS